MKKIIFFLILIFFFVSYSFADIPIRFFKEKVNIILGENNVFVHGLYFLKNESNTKFNLRLFYPFPIDSTHFFPEKIRVLDPQNPIVFITPSDRIEWLLHFEPLGVETTYVEYEQKIAEKSATYILTTTKLWKEKIDEAKFIIEAPLEFKDLNISIKPDSVKKKEDKQFFYITREDFLPDSDLKITWH